MKKTGIYSEKLAFLAKSVRFTLSYIMVSGA